MGSADRIERERHQKRARILEAARELFAERGFEAVTLREIAQRIEYSTTAIYVQFKDKAALVETMLTEDFAAFAKGLEEAAAIVDPVARIGALQDAYMEFALGMPHHYQLLFLTPPAGGKHGKHDSASPHGIEGYRVLHATVDECVRTKRFRPELDDVDAIAQVIWGTVHGLVSLRIVHGQHDAFHWASRDAHAQIALDMVLRGLLRDPSEAKKVQPRKTPRKRR